MNIQIIQVPYDSGHKDIRTGRGPKHILEHGLDRILRDAEHQVGVYSIESKAPLATEIGTAFELNRLLAGQVRSALDNKMFPLVLAGIGQSQVGVVWFDAHGDFNTPETTLSGFLDGMGLAMATGRCWQALLGTIPGFHPIPEANVVHIGGRDLDPEEERLLQQSEVEMIRLGEDANRVHKAIELSLDKLREKVTKVYVHVDMDILDPGEAIANHLAVPGGLSVNAVEKIIGMVKDKFEISAAAITCLEPEYDKDNKAVDAGIRIARALVA